MIERFEKQESGPLDGDAFLAQLAVSLEGKRSIPIPDTEVATVWAHQDDETIGVGPLFEAMPNSLMIHVTNGEPAELGARKSEGFSVEGQYAHTREPELENARFHIGHVGPSKLLEITDQEVARNIAKVALNLAMEFALKDTKVVFTHAYEGGHPDHDAVTCAVHLAKRMLERMRPPHFLTIIEAPLYRMEGDDSIRQEFVHYPDRQIHEITLTKREVIANAYAQDAHRSQHAVFNQENSRKRMSTTHKKFRVAPDYDFLSLPNNANLSKIYQQAGLSGDDWKKEVRKAMEELNLADRA